MSASLFLQAAYNQRTSRPPVWFMRQAGRYMPDYQALRQHYSFVDMVHTPELACKVTLQPIHTFGFDAAILYSDILVISEYFDLHFDFIEKQGPVLTNPCFSPHDILDYLTIPFSPDALHCVFEAIQLIVRELQPSNIPLIGFAGSPFTVACYLLEQGSSRTFSTVHHLISQDPKTLTRILDILTDVTIFHLTQQIQHGVQAIQLFDTWGCILNDTLYPLFSLTYLEKIFQALRPYDIPLIVFSKQTQRLLPALSTLPLHVISVDSDTSILPNKTIYSQFCFQGNLNPILLRDDLPEAINYTKTLLSEMSHYPGFIFNLGHGILPQTPMDHVKTIVELVQSAST